MAFRTESDLLGSIQVPAPALYGAQTQRAIENFPLGQQRTLGSFPTLTRALVQIKQAAAAINAEIGALEPAKAEAIIQAGAALLAGDLAPHFPVHAWHGGGGTSANMNANELLANLGEELLGGRRGEYRCLHPNDHVNLHQSTNDVYPSACRMAVIAQWPALEAALAHLEAAFEQQGAAGRTQRRLARTCLQDAVETTYGDLFGGYAGFLRRQAGQIGRAVDELHAVNLGGTIVGRPQDAPAAYRERVVARLGQIVGDNRYRPAENLFDAAQNPDDLAAVSGRLELLARGLIKLAQDIRLLGSGPEGGLGELILPAAQPGSSIMPGKVNPVIPEFLMQTCFRVQGLHAACMAGVDHGELDLNVWESSMTVAILEALELLEAGVRTFADKCVAGLHVNEEQNARHVETLIPLLTRLSQEHGYSVVVALCKEAGGSAQRLRVLLAERFAQTENRV